VHYSFDHKKVRREKRKEKGMEREGKEVK